MADLGNLELGVGSLLHHYMVLTITCLQAYHNLETIFPKTNLKSARGVNKVEYSLSSRGSVYRDLRSI